MNTGAIANQDLWKKLEAKLRDLEEESTLVFFQFWWIRRSWNEADSYAKAGTLSPSCSKLFKFRLPFTAR